MLSNRLIDITLVRLPNEYFAMKAVRVLLRLVLLEKRDG